MGSSTHATSSIPPRRPSRGVTRTILRVHHRPPASSQPDRQYGKSCRILQAQASRRCRVAGAWPCEGLTRASHSLPDVPPSLQYARRPRVFHSRSIDRRACISYVHVTSSLLQRCFASGGRRADERIIAVEPSRSRLDRDSGSGSELPGQSGDAWLSSIVI